MKTVNIENQTAQKIAAALVTKAFKDRFNLHPYATAEGIVKESKKQKVSPKESFDFVKQTLPGLVADFLTETEKELTRLTAPAI